MNALRRLASGSLVALILALAGCSREGATPAPATDTSAGTAGVSFDVTVFPPTNGTVTSQDGQIRCGTAGAACTGHYPWRVQAVLTATADAGYTFGTWGGDCQGSGTCVLDTRYSGADKYVIAVFGPGGQVQHGNFSSPTVHGPAFLDTLGGVPGSLSCASASCHGPSYSGAGIAPSCNACHASNGWSSWRTNCTFCHGTRVKAGYDFESDPPKAAPPDAVQQRLTGAAAPARTGAHRPHLTGVSASGGAFSAPFLCDTCHVVPADLSHVGGSASRATVVLSGAGQASLPASLGTYDPSSGTCTTYCHGNGKAPGTAPAFASAGIACDGCHGLPPPAPHPTASGDLAECAVCHPDTVASDGTLLAAGGKHVDGAIQAACDTCHALPPPTGAHVAHLGLDGSSGYGDTRSLQDMFPGATPTTAPGVYAFGCGNCHPLDFAYHNDGVPQVELYDATAPDGSLKRLAATTAAYDPGTGICSGVYCHSSGQAIPAFRATPAWSSGTHLACSGCHDNPPRYASGGAGSDTANSHLGMDDWMWVVGHFGGVGAVGHAERHGTPGSSEASITCQTCHFDTTDPSSTGVSGFYWLDTTGEYELTGRDPAQAPVNCTACHTGSGDATAKAGKVLPLRHVNGTRDVAFDPRTVLDPAIAYLPGAPNTPTRPYWRTVPSSPFWVNQVMDGTTVSFTLGGSTYDPVTKTCSVSCHNLAPSPGMSTVWGAPFAWECRYCHGDLYTY